MGDSALRVLGDPLPARSIEAFASSDACLKGPIGETVMAVNKKLRFGFDLYANLRPAKSYKGICPPALRPDIDLLIVRENSEGFYRALENEIAPGIWTASGVFTERGARRIADLSFRYAEMRSSIKHTHAKLALATKANIFTSTHGLYLEVFKAVAHNHPEVEFNHYYADAMCARLVKEPEQYDVIVSENLLADLLSDLAGQVAGGLGMTPGTNINYETKHAYFEPTHGCAPDIVGKDMANPIGQIRSAALMLEYLGMMYDDPKLTKAALEIESAIEEILNSADLSIIPKEVGGRASAAEVAEAISERIA
jgi:3-isopropylmalate dehydrogenase